MLSLVLFALTEDDGLLKAVVMDIVVDISLREDK